MHLVPHQCHESFCQHFVDHRKDHSQMGNPLSDKELEIAKQQQTELALFVWFKARPSRDHWLWLWLEIPEAQARRRQAEAMVYGPSQATWNFHVASLVPSTDFDIPEMKKLADLYLGINGAASTRVAAALIPPVITGLHIAATSDLDIYYLIIRDMRALPMAQRVRPSPSRDRGKNSSSSFLRSCRKYPRRLPLAPTKNGWNRERECVMKGLSLGASFALPKIILHVDE
ncbi:hypothetical protein DFH09DRAFT_1112734 [Mycena vulgaris]|nr:hypothetical protein DFH09DRAFT_1112734 [Mycena vulgaris]